MINRVIYFGINKGFIVNGGKFFEEFKARKLFWFLLWTNLLETSWLLSLLYRSSSGNWRGLRLSMCMLKSSLNVMKRSAFWVVQKSVGFFTKHFTFEEDFKTRAAGLRFGVMVGSFRRNIRTNVTEKVFGFKPVTINRFRHTSNKGVDWKHLYIVLQGTKQWWLGLKNCLQKPIILAVR